LLTARNEAEFKELSTIFDSQADVEVALDDSVEVHGRVAPLFEIFRTEAMLAGSLDSDARAVMDNVLDAVLVARQSAWGIREPWKEYAAPWQDLRKRENEKAAREADEALRRAIAEVEACAAGRLACPTSWGGEAPANVESHQDGPVTEDCRSFRIGNEVLSLTPGQAAVVAVYWNARIAGASEYSEAAALVEAGLEAKRIRDLFKKKDKGKSVIDRAYGKLFKKGTKRGMLSLNLPA
jgi:hypothetical protein